LVLNLRSLIFAFEENKTILKFNSPPDLQCPFRRSEEAKHLLKQVHIWTYFISFHNIDKRDCTQTEYSVRPEDPVLQN
jgi:hypothetical protein